MRVEELNKKKPKEVYNKYPHFPSRLITDDPDGVPHFVIGTGGDGKTFNELVEAIKIYQSGVFMNQTAILYPTKDEVLEQIANKNLFDKLLAEPETAEEYGEFIEQLTYEKDWVYYKGEPFCRLYAISMHAKYKPQDHSRIGNVWMDEFQRERYQKNEAFKIQDLIATIKRKKKPEEFRVVFTSNAISLAAPILIAFRIYELDETEDSDPDHPTYKIITKIYSKNDVLIAKVWNWKRPKEDVIAQNNDDVWMEIFQQSGYFDYRYGNEFKNDSLSNIIGKVEGDTRKYLNHIHLYKCQELYVNVYYIDKEFNDTKDNIYFFEVEENPNLKEVAYALSKDDVRDNVQYSPRMATEIAKKLMKNRLYYDNVATKQAVLETMLKFF